MHCKLERPNNVDVLVAFGLICRKYRPVFVSLACFDLLSTMWSLFTGRRGSGNLPQREPLWKRVERLEETVSKLQKTEKDRLEKERVMKEETKTQELMER